MIAWDISHQEFTIEDHYYFSILKRALKSEGIEVLELEDLDDLKSIKPAVLVINYPEKPFSDEDVEKIMDYIENGGRVIVAGYYKNEDNIADTINTLTKHFGLELMKDSVKDNIHNHEGDPLFVVTSIVEAYNRGVTKVLMPCTASIRIASTNNIKIIMKAEPTAETSSGNEPILAVETFKGKGSLILLGTCVFWDNYSIEKYDNKNFSMNLLMGLR